MAWTRSRKKAQGTQSPLLMGIDFSDSSYNKVCYIDSTKLLIDTSTYVGFRTFECVYGAKIIDDTIIWTYNDTLITPVFQTPKTSFSNIISSAPSDISCLFMEGYRPRETGFWNSANSDKCIGIGANNVAISDARFTDPSDFAEEMIGKIILYKLSSNNRLVLPCNPEYQ